VTYCFLCALFEWNSGILVQITVSVQLVVAEAAAVSVQLVVAEAAAVAVELVVAGAAAVAVELVVAEAAAVAVELVVALVHFYSCLTVPLISFK
jgi:hypothetical protein